MSELERDTEIRRIAHLLNVETSELSYLESLDAEQLDQFSEKMSDAIHRDQGDVWQRLAAVAKFMPNFINAKVAEDILGSHITANLTYYIPQKDAVAIARSLSTPFLADVAGKLVPEKAADLLNSFPLDVLNKVVDHLYRKEEWFVMGSFVDVLEIERIMQLMPRIETEKALLLIAGYTRKKDHISKVVEQMNDEKVTSLIATAVFNNLWDQMFTVARHLSDSEKQRMNRLIATLESDFYDAARRKAETYPFWPELKLIFDESA